MTAPVQIPADLPAALVPLAWLLGTWRGVGVGGQGAGPAGPDSDFRFGQEVVFRWDGDPLLAYDSRTWLLDEAGEPGRPHVSESGFWRPGPAVGEVEVVLASSGGVVEVYVGAQEGPRIELGTDVVARTATGAPYTAGHRLYGLVEGDLLYAHDMALGDQPLRPAMSARLKRAGQVAGAAP